MLGAPVQASETAEEKPVRLMECGLPAAASVMVKRAGALPGCSGGEGDIDGTGSGGSDGGAAGAGFREVAGDGYIGNGERAVAGVVHSNRLLGACGANLLRGESERSGGKGDDGDNAFA